jgi:hypothetical protein
LPGARTNEPPTHAKTKLQDQEIEQFKEDFEPCPKGPHQHHSSSLSKADTQPISKPYPQEVTRITDQLKEWMDPQGPSLQTAWPMIQTQDPIEIAN